MVLEQHNPNWALMFKQEALLIESSLDSDEFLDIQHIGSTAIMGIKAMSIIDIAVLVTPDEFIQGYVRPMKKIGYEFFPASSSIERLFFHKGTPTQFHLSITQEGGTPFWERQILFRDYLNNHIDAAKEYEQLKEQLLLNDPSAGQAYSDGKSEFVKKILILFNNRGN